MTARGFSLQICLNVSRARCGHEAQASCQGGMQQDGWGSPWTSAPNSLWLSCEEMPRGGRPAQRRVRAARTLLLVRRGRYEKMILSDSFVGSPFFKQRSGLPFSPAPACGRALTANDRAGYDEFHATIKLAACSGIV